jgi:hypothetical protein
MYHITENFQQVHFICISEIFDQSGLLLYNLSPNFFPYRASIQSYRFVLNFLQMLLMLIFVKNCIYVFFAKFENAILNL